MICVYCLARFPKPVDPPEYGSMFCSADCATKDADELEAERQARLASVAVAYRVTSPQPRPKGMHVYDVDFVSKYPPELLADGTTAVAEVTFKLRKPT